MTEECEERVVEFIDMWLCQYSCQFDWQGDKGAKEGQGDKLNKPTARRKPVRLDIQIQEKLVITLEYSS